jgi:signal transduction histidine kinase
LLRELDPKSMMAVPLRGRDRLLGGLLFISSTETRRYGPGDLDLAKELALRAALAIDNARLYETARRATQLRDDLLGIVAHDLRNPLSAILMQAARLHRRGAGPERRDRKPVDAIERAAGRANRLIQDLLDVTRMEAGRLAVEPTRLAARQVASNCLEAQETLASSASVALRLDVPENLPEIWADRDRLLQVFENLIGNAVKFTPPGGLVTVAAAPQDGDVQFSVADTGEGIAPDDLPHVFDRFWQARKAERRGAGLGLPIVKGIVEAHGGRIWVESTPGRGSTFFFTIPAAAPGPDLALPCAT